MVMWLSGFVQVKNASLIDLAITTSYKYRQRQATQQAGCYSDSHVYKISNIKMFNRSGKLHSNMGQMPGKKRVNINTVKIFNKSSMNQTVESAGKWYKHMIYFKTPIMKSTMTGKKLLEVRKV